MRQVKEEARIQAACGHHSFIAGAVARWQTKKRLYIGKRTTLFRQCIPVSITRLTELPIKRSHIRYRHHLHHRLQQFLSPFLACIKPILRCHHYQQQSLIVNC